MHHIEIKEIKCFVCNSTKAIARIIMAILININVGIASRPYYMQRIGIAVLSRRYPADPFTGV